MSDKQMVNAKAVTAVYTLGNGSHYKNWELRFSLRSIDKYLSNVSNVVVVGSDPGPGFLVNKIAAKDVHQIPDSNIFDKLLIACQSDKVTDQFLFMNDDHFLLDYFNAAEFPNYYCDSMAGHVKKSRIRGTYQSRVQNTAKLFPDGLFYDVHTPILYEKEKFLRLKEVYDYSNGMVIKSLYGNTYKLPGIEQVDRKIISPPNMKREEECKIISTFPRVTSAMFQWMEQQFPYQSKYEK